jgi:DNA-binding phage protein
MTKTTKDATYDEQLRRSMLRSRFHSLFWAVILNLKSTKGLKLQDVADRLGVNKSFVSRSFSKPPNWRIDTIADFADALDLDLVIEAHDRKTGRVFTPAGVRQQQVIMTRIEMTKPEKATSFATKQGAVSA